MKLSDVVRGVEKKDRKLNNGRESWVYFSDGYNSLASAEVVVDREKLKALVNIDGLLLRKDFENEVTEAIATAIESGAVIKIKEQK